MRRAVIAAVLALAFVSCQQHNESKTEDNRARMNPIVEPSQSLPSKRTPAAAPAQTRIDLAEYDIRMADTLHAGAQSFYVVNAGKMNHSLAIEGNGVNVDLKQGTYTFYCPVDGHKQHGMSRTITVQQ